LDERGLINKDGLPETAKVSIDDTVLVEQCRRGDSLAMERLILKYQNRIYNIIRKMCGNADDAAELTQDTFVKVIENIDKFEGRSSLYTWTFRIAVNLALSYCQRNAKLGFRSLDSEDNEHNQQAKGALKEFLSDESSRNPAEVTANKELCKIALTALMKLDDAQRAVIILRDIEGMNYNRIAEVLDIELGTVKSRLSRARSNLRKVLEAVLR
jgi:RNA polymerase sigma-70 factor (ECF subfamily)